MARTFNCRDVRVDCDFVAHCETEQEVLQQCAEHAHSLRHERDPDGADREGLRCDPRPGSIAPEPHWQTSNCSPGKSASRAGLAILRISTHYRSENLTRYLQENRAI